MQTIIGWTIYKLEVYFSQDHYISILAGECCMNFNEKLIDLRKAKGLSQEELGDTLGVSRQTILKWELAQSYPDS